MMSNAFFLSSCGKRPIEKVTEVHNHYVKMEQEPVKCQSDVVVKVEQAPSSVSWWTKAAVVLTFLTFTKDLWKDIWHVSFQEMQMTETLRTWKVIEWLKEFKVINYIQEFLKAKTDEQNEQ